MIRGGIILLRTTALLGMFMVKAQNPVVYERDAGGKERGRNVPRPGSVFVPWPPAFFGENHRRVSASRPVPPTLLKADWAKPKFKDRSLITHVLHIDRFGNCVLSVETAEATDCFAAGPG